MNSKESLGIKHHTTAEIFKGLAEVFYLQKNYPKSFQHHQLALQSLFPNFNETDYYQNPTLQNCLSQPVLLEVLQSKAQTFLQYYTEETQTPKDLQAALSAYHLATELIAEMRQGYKAEGSKLVLAEKATTLFDGAIEAALLTAQTSSLPQNILEHLPNPLQKGNFSQFPISHLPFHYSEQSKAVLLLSGIKDTEAKATANIPEELLQQEYDLRIELTYLDKRIQQEELKNEQKDETQIREWQSQHFDYQQEYDQLIEQFEKDYPEYYELKYQLETATTQDLQSHLQTIHNPRINSWATNSNKIIQPSNNPTILSYHLTPKKIYLFHITATTYQIHELDRPDNLAQLIEDLQDAITLADIAEYIEAAGNLFDLLLLPALKEYPNNTNGKLTIIPHDLLATLPFDALIDRRQLQENEWQMVLEKRDFSALPYVIKNFDISYHYSATLLLNSIKRHAQTATQSPSFIGFAPVSFEGKTSGEGEQTELAIATNRGKTRVLRSNRAGQVAMDNLPSTENEVKDVFNLFEAQALDAKAFLYASANKQNLLENVQNHKYVLIATHGYVQDGNENLSGIYLASPKKSEEISKRTDTKESEIADNTYRRFSKTSLQTPEHINTTENYILHTSETYHLPLNADLVVLSSCSSGVGKIAKGEGMMAMNRGFLYAGASNIVFTHFDVPDESSGELVKTLFKYILEGESYASALRKAKLALIQQSLKTPEDWAGYALIGG
ncbi:MAG: CHAT domain-containing protein [Chitinophagales bacterium]